jgi:hypothetical protein
MPLARFVLRKMHEKATPRLLSLSELAAIVKTNAFTSRGPVLRAKYACQDKAELKDAIPTTSLFLAPSFLNHSC